MAVCRLFSWPPRLLCSRGMPVCARGWDAGPSEGRSSGGMFCASTGDVGRGQTRLQLGVCCRTREGTEGFGLGEQREWRSSVGTLPGLLAGVLCGWVEAVC